MPGTTRPSSTTPSAVAANSRLPEFEGRIFRKTLANGLKAIAVPTPHTDHFYLGLMVRAGARLETAETYGVSHFLEHMMFRGSKSHPDFTALAEAFERLGGDWNAATGHEHTEYWYSGIIHTADRVAELFADFLEHPALKDIEVERQVIQRELDGELNDHGHSTDLDYHIATIFWPGTSMAHPILGTRGTIGAMTIDRLKKYRDQHYAPGNMAVCLGGGSNGDEMMALLEKHFAGHRSAFAAAKRLPFPPVKKFVGPKAKWIEHSDNEYEIRLSFLCDGEWSDEAQGYEILSRILADGFCARLTKRLREELGLVYDLTSHTVLSHDFGTLEIAASAAADPAEQLDEFLAELLTLIKRFALEGPTAEELDRIRTRALVDLELSIGHPEMVATKLSWGAISDQEASLLKDRERLLAYTCEDLKALCAKIFTKGRAALAVLGPKEDGIEARLQKALEIGLP